MEIEAKPKLPRSYAQRMLQYVISAHTTGKMTDEQWKQFLENTEKVFLDDMQLVAEIAFNKGREYERRNGESKT